MRFKNRLYDKSFNLKDKKIYGGRVDTYTECTSETNSGGCSTDLSKHLTDDNGVTVEYIICY